MQEKKPGLDIHFLEAVETIRTPCYILDRALLAKNLEILDFVRRTTNCKILLALKGFAMWSVFDQIAQKLDGTSASALFEARLGREKFPGQVHMCAPAYRDDEIDDILSIVDHLVFNSFTQWERFKPGVAACKKPVSCAIRVNPEHSEVKTAIYDPCAPGSRLGTTRKNFRGDRLDGITGLHFHTLCELNADSLERTLAAFENKFGEFISRMKWINFGGGHHITRPDYDVDKLCSLINRFKKKYDVEVFLEPGEAIALNTGFLVASVLDIIQNDIPVAILDTSASAHMPDVLEMPYRPEIQNAQRANELSHTYRLGGMTCLAGDVIGDYSFSKPLQPGDKLIFHDMAHYTMVKNTMFNGIQLPDIVIYDPAEKKMHLQRRFTYEDFRNRLS